MLSSTINLKVPMTTKQDCKQIIVMQTPVKAEMLKNLEEKLFVLMQHKVLMLTSSN